MDIVVCGWYYHKPFYLELLKIKNKYPVTVVAHRSVDTHVLQTVEVDNIGLEFGAYDYYLKRLWVEPIDVVFMHDDTNIKPGLFEEIEKVVQR